MSDISVADIDAELKRRGVAPPKSKQITQQDIDAELARRGVSPTASTKPQVKPKATTPAPVALPTRQQIDDYRLNFFNTDNPKANVPKQTATALATNPNDPQVLATLSKMSPVGQAAIREHAGEIKAENDRTQAYIHSFDGGASPQAMAESLHSIAGGGGFVNPVQVQAYKAQDVPGFDPSAAFKGPEGARQGKMTGHGKLDPSLNVLADFAAFGATPEGAAFGEAMGTVGMLGEAAGDVAKTTTKPLVKALTKVVSKVATPKAVTAAATLMGEGDAVNRLMKGDKQGAATSAVLGLVPLGVHAVSGKIAAKRGAIDATGRATERVSGSDGVGQDGSTDAVLRPPSDTDVSKPAETVSAPAEVPSVSGTLPTPEPKPAGVKVGRVTPKPGVGILPEQVKSLARDGFTKAADLYAAAKKTEPNLTKEEFAQQLYEFHKAHADDGGTHNYEGGSGDVKAKDIFIAKNAAGEPIRYYGFSEKTPPKSPAPPPPTARRFSIDPQKSESPRGDSASNSTKLANEHVNEERKRYGLNDLPDAIPDSHKDAYERALATGEHDKAFTTAQDVLDKSRAMTIEEAAGNSMKQHEVKNTVNDLAAKIREGVEAGKDTSELQAQYHSAREDFRLLSDASKRSGTLQSQAFSFRQEVLDDYSHNNLMQRMGEARPEVPVTAEEERAALKLSGETQKAIEEHEATQTDERKSQLAADEHVENLVRETRKQARVQTREQIRANREDIHARLARKLSGLHSVVDAAGVLAKAAPEIGELAKSFVDEGVLTVEDLVDKVHDFVKGHAEGVTKREVRDAISGYGYDKPMRPATVLGDLKEQARLMSKIEDVHDPLPPGTPRKVSQAVMKLREEYKQAKENMSPEEKALVDTKQQIENLEKKIKAGDVSGPKRLITVDNPEMMQAKKQLKDTRQTYNRMVKDAKAKNIQPPPDPFARYKGELDKKIADLNDQIGRGVKDPPKTTARRLYDAEVTAKRAEVERLKKMQDQMVRSRMPKTRLQKFARYHRAVILSRVSTLGKLGGAAAERLAFDPLEDVANKALEAIPGYGKLARMSPNARGSLRATGKAFSTAFSRNAIAEARDSLRTGMNSKDALHGGHDPQFAEPPSVANFPGRVHKAIKTPIQLAAYEKSIVKQEDWAQRRGLDLSDPGVQAAMEGRAYLESKRAILMQENTVTNLYSKHVLRALERSGTQAGRNVAAGLRAAMPIVSVPTNFAGEVGLHVGGAGRAGFEIAMAKGVDNLTPEQADIVTRALKKQAVGVALAAIGWDNYNNFGGYYSKGGNKINDLDPGSARIPWKVIPAIGREGNYPTINWTDEIPHTFLHSPQVEVMSMFADLHQRFDNWKETKSSETRGGDASFATAKGFGESIPFFDIFSEFARAEESPKAGAVKFGETIGSATLPGLLPDLASMKDKDSRGKTRKRTPQGALDALEISAGLRELVPESR